MCWLGEAQAGNEAVVKLPDLVTSVDPCGINLERKGEGQLTLQGKLHLDLGEEFLFFPERRGDYTAC